MAASSLPEPTPAELADVAELCAPWWALELRERLDQVHADMAIVIGWLEGISNQTTLVADVVEQVAQAKAAFEASGGPAMLSSGPLGMVLRQFLPPGLLK